MTKSIEVRKTKPRGGRVADSEWADTMADAKQKARIDVEGFQHVGYPDTRAIIYPDPSGKAVYSIDYYTGKYDEKSDDSLARKLDKKEPKKKKQRDSRTRGSGPVKVRAHQRSRSSVRAHRRRRPRRR